MTSYSEVSIYHVAQLAWIAGLMLPQAMRAALLPYLGEVRDEPEKFASRIGPFCASLVKDMNGRFPSRPSAEQAVSVAQPMLS